MIDIKTELDAVLVEAQAALDKVSSTAAKLVTKATSLVTIAQGGGASAEGATAVNADLQTSLDTKNAELEALKKSFNDLLASHPNPPAGTAALPVAEKAAS